MKLAVAAALTFLTAPAFAQMPPPGPWPTIPSLETWPPVEIPHRCVSPNYCVEPAAPAFAQTLPPGGYSNCRPGACEGTPAQMLPRDGSSTAAADVDQYGNATTLPPEGFITDAHMDPDGHAIYPAYALKFVQSVTPPPPYVIGIATGSRLVALGQDCPGGTRFVVDISLDELKLRICTNTAK